MPSRPFGLKPTDKVVREYYAALGKSAQVSISHELGLRPAFETLLESCARRFHGWTLAHERTLRQATFAAEAQ